MNTYKTAADVKPNEQEQALNEYLGNLGIEYSAACKGEKSRDGWTCDEWSVLMTRPDGKTLDAEYFTGTGHRVAIRPMPSDLLRLNPRTIALVEWVRHNVKPHKPQAAGVLYSLLMDSEAADETFTSWCARFGYDKDSIKARSTYDDCQRNADKLMAFFKPSEREQLAKLLEDY